MAINPASFIFLGESSSLVTGIGKGKYLRLLNIDPRERKVIFETPQYHPTLYSPSTNLYSEFNIRKCIKSLWSKLFLKVVFLYNKEFCSFLILF